MSNHILHLQENRKGFFTFSGGYYSVRDVSVPLNFSAHVDKENNDATLTRATQLYSISIDLD
jgi:hypothetical protein